jgi:hypothetical protein
LVQSADTYHTSLGPGQHHYNNEGKGDEDEGEGEDDDKEDEEVENHRSMLLLALGPAAEPHAAEPPANSLAELTTNSSLKSSHTWQDMEHPLINNGHSLNLAHIMKYTEKHSNSTPGQEVLYSEDSDMTCTTSCGVI